MAKKNWMKEMSSLPGALNERRDIHATVIQTPSPSFNFIYANGHGLPRGHNAIAFGPPHSGKSVLFYLHAGQVHRDYPDAWVLKFDTEFRDEAQLTPEMAAVYGIDWDRYKSIQTNHPAEIYDTYEKKIAPWCEDGMDLALVGIDSVGAVRGRRGISNDGGIMVQQQGDVAQTNKLGLQAILHYQRKFHTSIFMTSHVTPETDMIEQKRGNKFKMGASVGVQHNAEYFIYVERDATKAGRVNLLEEDLVNEDLKDMEGRSEATGHKIWFCMKDNVLGVSGRHGEFTFDYHKGVINQHEEVFLLGYRRGIIHKDGAHFFTIPGYEMPKLKGQANFVKWLRDDPKAQAFVSAELVRRDRAGEFKMVDEEDKNAWAANTPPPVEEEATASA